MTMAFLSVRSFSRISKGTPVALLLVAVALLNANAVECRNRNITAEGNFPDLTILGVWNDSFKAVENCSRFRSENTSDYYFLWPEPNFKFCCGVGLNNYTYTTYGPPLATTIYYDIGPVDKCLPYWKCPQLREWRRLTDFVTFYTYCEKGDMQTFYTKRLLRVMVLNGIFETALPWMVILEIGVFLAIGALSSSGWWGTASAQSSSWREAVSDLWWDSQLNNITNFLHLLLLVVIGNCFMEAAGHSDPYQWASSLFLKFLQFHLVFPIMLTFAVILQQTADWGAARNSINHEPSRSGDLGQASDGENGGNGESGESDGENGGNGESGESDGENGAHDGVTVQHEDDVAKGFVSISVDWKWQQLSGLVMLLFFTISYCVYSSDDHRTEFASFVLGLAVACYTWSGIISLSLVLRSMQCFYENRRPSRPSELSP